MDLRYDASETIKSKHLLVFKSPQHDLNIERYLVGAWIKYFNSIMVETGNKSNLIPGSVEGVIGGKGILLIKLRQIGRWKQHLTRRYHQAKFGELVQVWKIASCREFEQHQGQRVGQ
jgi:hypothetical protein